jgi:hypothetical protein
MGTPTRANGLSVPAGAAPDRAAFPQTSIDEARRLVERAIEKIPRLTCDGVAGRELRTARGAVFVDAEAARLQRELWKHLREVAIAADWVKHLTPIKTVCTRLNSDGHKDRVERWCERQGYIESISNGALIAAAVGLGFAFRIYPPNVCFGFGLDSFRELLRDDQHSEFLFPPWWP